MEITRAKFTKYVTGKSVAFVAMTPAIKNRGLGYEIDGFDIVYRTNMFPIWKDLQGDYGHRCDVISYQKYYKHLARTFHTHGVLVQIPHLSEKERPDFQYPFLFVSRGEREQMAQAIQGQTGKEMLYPSSGIVAYFLTLGCSQFKYFGITGYQDKKGNIIDHTQGEHYLQEYKIQWGERASQIEATQMTNNPIHNFEAQNEFTRYLINQGLVEIDPYSKQFFK